MEDELERLVNALFDEVKAAEQPMDRIRWRGCRTWLSGEHRSWGSSDSSCQWLRSQIGLASNVRPSIQRSMNRFRITN